MLQKIIEITHQAAAIAKEGYTQKKQIDYKSQIDLVTQYDKKVEHYLTQHLLKHFSDFEIVGEEFGSSGQSSTKKIIIDPIDGTTNFVHGLPFFAISIGVVIEGVLQHGVVYNPILDELYSASKGEGSFCNGVRLQVSQSDNLTSSLIATGFPYTKIKQGFDYEWTVKSFENVLPYTRDIRRLGAASLDLCYVASGSFDGYYEINLKPWDVSAGVLILREAGGTVTNGVSDDYGLEDKLIVATNGKIHKELTQKLADIN
ncbi:MAG: inositol monophosphatase family protein [Campylobacterota bacterium]